MPARSSRGASAARSPLEVKRRVGYLPDSVGFYDHLTAVENLAYTAKLMGLSLAERALRIANALSRVRLTEVAHKRVATYSRGMRQRLGLAEIIVKRAEIAILDDPTSGLDPIMSDVINELILRTRRAHLVTSIVVTHDMRTARKVADRVVMLYPLARLKPDEPQIIFDGPPSDLDRTKDRRVQQFVHGEAGERLMEIAEQRAG